ncbi:MAG: LacI family DNA-binding transcriptional regulator [Oceanospirillaceae bacterium]|nr:LacI family DNA-binding transcriptional regulator [Oceanospirillaceae bacterium]
MNDRKTSLKPTRRPTIADVAEAAGVSRTTVSHALNDRGQVDPRTRERVKTIAASLGYRPNLRAQRLRTGRSNCIALLSSMPFAVAGGPSRLGFMMEIAATATEAALKQGLALVLVPPMREARGLLDELDIDGAVIIEPVANDPQVEQLQRRGLDVISIGRQPAMSRALPYVDLQGGATGRLLLDHLRHQGARQVALLIGGQPRHSYVDVERTYREFCDELGMACLIAKADEAGGEAAGGAACRALLAKHPEIDAICAPVDAFAVGAVAALQSLGLSVPDDVMVATRYDGLRARSCTPPLTAVNLHLEEVSRLAIELLFEHISDKDGRAVVRAPAAELIARESTRAG